MKAIREGAIGWLLYGGCGLSLVCGLGTFFLSFGAAVGGAGRELSGIVVLGAIFTVLGVVASLASLGWGLLSVKNLHRGQERTIPMARVVARYALDRAEVMHTDEFSIEAIDRPRFFVRLDLGDGDNAEYACAAPVFWSAGEGMRGTATVQGQWLSQFVPLLGTPEAGEQRAFQ